MSTKKLHIASFTERLNVLISEISGGNVTEFAKKSGINQATMHNYAKGRIPSAEALNNICNRLGVNINWLFTGRGPLYIAELGNHEDNELINRITKDLRELHELSPKSIHEISVYVAGILKGFKLARSEPESNIRNGPIKNGTYDAE